VFPRREKEGEREERKEEKKEKREVFFLLGVEEGGYLRWVVVPAILPLTLPACLAVMDGGDPR
jgi:hypothetical protein